MQNIFFISDTHFGHENIIKFTHRRHSSIESHDESIIENINDLVKKRDYLYHLGDFCWGDTARKQTEFAKEILSRIVCKNIHLVMGNHDPCTNDGQPREDFAKLFKTCTNYKSIRIPETTQLKNFFDCTRRKVILCHYAIRSWHGMHGGSYHLYGHSHGTLPDNGTRSFDVGVDETAAYQEDGLLRPISSFEVCERLMNRSLKTVDGHGIIVKENNNG